MTPAVPPAAALGWLAAMAPGLEAAALLGADGRVLAGDRALAGVLTADMADVIVVRGPVLTLAARVEGPLLRGLLRADMAMAVAVAEATRAT
jgi:hypothetical protein